MLVADPAAEGGAVAAAMEERGIPFHLSGPAALFQRPEVRDAIAWLRVLADPDDSAGGGAGADPAADRAALRRPGAADDDRPAAQARHGLRLRGGARQPPVPARGARADPGLPQALRRSLGGDGGAPRRRLRAAADRARRPAPPAPLRRPARGRRAAARALAAGRAGDRLGAARAARLDPRLRPPTSAPSPRPGSSRPAARSRPRPAPVQGMALDAVKGIGFDHVFVLGLEDEADWTRIGWPARTGLVLSRVERGEDGEARPSPLLRARRWPPPGGEEEEHERGAVRPRRGPARDLPHAARGGAGGVLAGRAASSPSRASTPRSTSTGRSPATSSC